MLEESRTFTMHSNEEMRKERKTWWNGGKHVANKRKNSQILSVVEHPTTKARQEILNMVEREFQVQHCKIEKFQSVKL